MIKKYLCWEKMVTNSVSNDIKSITYFIHMPYYFMSKFLVPFAIKQLNKKNKVQVFSKVYGNTKFVHKSQL